MGKTKEQTDKHTKSYKGNISAIFSSLGALGPGPCGGPPKTIRQRNIILNHSVVGGGGGGGG